MKLTRQERSAIFRGDYRALKRPRKPEVKPGQTIVLSWTRGGKQVVNRDTGETIDIPRKPTVWIKLAEPQLREGEWLVRFEAHDEREPRRFLAGTPNPGHEVALKTRPGGPREIGELDLESERGYKGSANRGVDHLESVPDESLAAFSTEARARFAQHREAERSDQVLAQQGKQLMRAIRRLHGDAIRHGVDFSPQLLELLSEMKTAIADKRAA